MQTGISLSVALESPVGLLKEADCQVPYLYGRGRVSITAQYTSCRKVVD